MAESTGIAWSRSSWSPWIGCTEISPGCDACYARELDARHRYGGRTHWGIGVPRHRTSDSYWAKPPQWDALAAEEKRTGRCAPAPAGAAKEWKMPGFWPVFPSMCDPFDNDAPEDLRARLWDMVLATPNLTWLLLTKRVGNVGKLSPHGRFENVWIGASVVNQQEADRDLPKLVELTRFGKRFVSYEPALGPVVLRDEWLDDQGESEFDVLPVIDQVIVGGESHQGKHRARPFSLSWARSVVRQCKLRGRACFVKQLGSNPVDEPEDAAPFSVKLKNRAGSDPTEWEAGLRVQEFPL